MTTDKFSKPLQACAQVTARLIHRFESIPQSLIAFIGRFSIAAVFWQSAQTKVDNFSIDLIAGNFQLGWPQLSDSAVALFRDEYKIPLMAPELAAPLAAVAEHLLALLLLLGLGSRFAACGLLITTLVIQIFVYPDAYPTHGTWIAVLLFIMVYGPGRISLDYALNRHIQKLIRG